MELSGLITELEENRNELLAESMEKYMQDKFRFLGIRGPKRTELYKKYFPTARKTKVIDWNFIEYTEYGTTYGGFRCLVKRYRS